MWLINEDGHAINTSHVAMLVTAGNGTISGKLVSGQIVRLIDAGNPINAQAAIKRLTGMLNDAQGVVTVDLSNEEDADYINQGVTPEDMA